MLPFFIGIWICITPVQFVGEDSIHQYDLNHHVMLVEFAGPEELTPTDIRIMDSGGNVIPIRDVFPVQQVDGDTATFGMKSLWALIVPRLQLRETYTAIHHRTGIVHSYFFNGFVPNLVKNPMH